MILWSRIGISASALLWVSLIGAAGFFSHLARAEFQVPPLAGPVMDTANILQPETEQRLTSILRRLHESGGTQLQVVTVPDLGGAVIEEAALKMAEQYGLGSAKGDNGVLLLVAAQERRIRIEVGQGREGDLPDARASRIIRDVMVPRFREGSADRAVWAGVMAILHFTDAQFLESSGEKAPQAGRRSRPLVEKFGPLFFLLFFLVVLLNGGGRRGLRRHGLGGVFPGGFGGGGFGGGGFGGGGGWSGGGGGFSGGGASGGW